MLSVTTKKLLSNVIRHTDTHNRILEQSEMWRQHKKITEEKPRSTHERSRERSRKDSTSRAHMDRSEDYQSLADDSRSLVSTQWTRELQDTEEADPGRWGHGGYKELYPDEFKRDRSRTPSKSPPKKVKKNKKSSKKKKKKSKKKKRKHDTESDGSDSESERKARKRQRKARKEEKTQKDSTHKHSNLSKRLLEIAEGGSSERKASDKRAGDGVHKDKWEDDWRSKEWREDDRRSKDWREDDRKSKDWKEDERKSKVWREDDRRGKDWREDERSYLSKRKTDETKKEDRGLQSRNPREGNMFGRALRAVSDEQRNNPAPRRNLASNSKDQDDKRLTQRGKDQSYNRSRQWSRSLARGDSPYKSTDHHRHKSSKSTSRSRSRSPIKGSVEGADHSHNRRYQKRSRERSSNRDKSDSGGRVWRKRRYSNTSSSSESSSSVSVKETKSKRNRSDSSSSSSSSD